MPVFCVCSSVFSEREASRPPLTSMVESNRDSKQGERASQLNLCVEDQRRWAGGTGPQTHWNSELLSIAVCGVYLGI